MAKDPICGMTVDETSPLHAERDGQTFYFCSEHCRKKFLTTPAATKHEEKTPVLRHDEEFVLDVVDLAEDPIPEDPVAAGPLARSIT